MTYRQALAALDARQETRIELGLERVKAHLARLGDPQERVPAFHVAGTNGKGSTCAMMASCLSAAGYRIGLYTSPHLQDVRERIRVSGRAITEKEFAKVVTKTLAAESAGAKLTYFEILTVAAFLHFAEKKCDVVVLETGLGGRLDATNVVERPAACVITSIGYDHMAYLGKTLGKIAGEKAGIAKRGTPLICAKLAPEAMRAVRGAAMKAGAPLTVVSRPWPRRTVNWTNGQQGFTAPFGAVSVGILGEKQGMNAALVYHALKAAPFPVTDAQMRRGFKSVVWKNRFEIRRVGAKTAILDGAHNVEAMENLARTFRGSPFFKRRALWIVGVLKDKDARALLRPIAPLIKEAVAVEPVSPRALGAAALAERIGEAAPRAATETAATALSAVRGWKRSTTLPRTAVVCGSFYLTAGVSRELGAR